MSRRLLILLPALAFAAACTETKPEAPPKPAEPVAAPTPPAPPPPPEDKVTASISGKSDPDCLAPMTAPAADAKAQAVKLGKRQGEIKGYKLTLKSKPDEDDQAVIGVIAGIVDASPANLALVDESVKYFQEKGAELIVAAGDIGDSKESIQTTLARLAKGGIPVVAIAGNWEPKDGFRDAVAAVPGVINGNKVREIDWDDATVVTLPGLHDKQYLHEDNGPGCQYFAEDLDEMAEALKTAPAPVVLVAHDPPAGKDPGSVDFMGEMKHHAGDANLTKLIASSNIPFGVFPNIKEAGGKATADTEGARAVAEGTMSDTLYLNPGAADSSKWTLNDGSTASGMAAVLTVKGKQASYAIFKAPAAKPAEEKPLAKDQ